MFVRTLIGFALFFLINAGGFAQVYSVSEVDDGVLSLTEWRLLGPFSHKESSGIHFNELYQFNKAENLINYDDFVSLKPGTERNTVNKLVKGSSPIVKFSELLEVPETELRFSNIYAGCLLESESDKKVMLNFSANDCSKIWLNNEVIHQANVIHNDIRYYNNYLELDLEKGNNFLLVKVYNHNRDGGMFACLERWTKAGEKRNRVDFPIRFDHKFLERSIIENDSLCITWSFPQNIKGKLSVNGEKADTIFNVEPGQKFISNISKLPDGLYQTKFFCSLDTLTQFFFKGNIHNDIEEKIEILKSRECVGDIRNNIEAYSFRYHHLMKSEHLPDKHYMVAKWQRRIIFVYQGIKKLYHNYFNDEEGCFTDINTYVSKIDSGVQFYQLFLPEGYEKQTKLPLMIEFPVPIKRFLHPLESWQFADIELSELFTRLANKYNIAILDFGGRTVDIMNGNNIDVADLWENLNAVDQLINIDSTRIYLRGACQAAYNAIKLGAKYPDQWAAISIMSPRLLTELNDTRWNAQNDPLKFLGNLWETPILNYHSPLDLHTNIAVSEYFSALCKREKLDKYYCKYPEMEFAEYYSSEYLHQTIEFFLKYSLGDRNRNEIRFSTYSLKNNRCKWFSILSMQSFGGKASVKGEIENNVLKVATNNINSFKIDLNRLPFEQGEKLIIKQNDSVVYNAYANGRYVVINQCGSDPQRKNSVIEGPFAHIFSEPFIVIPGTSGTKEENDANKRMAKLIQQQWEDMYFHKCRVKSDKNITDEDIEKCHLLLIGNEASNLLIDKYRKQLPFKSSVNSVTFRGEDVVGEDLSFYCVYPNPDNNHKYVGVLGYNNPQTFNICFEDGIYQYDNISYLGWYDFKVWTSKREVLEKSYFDQFWQ